MFCVDRQTQNKYINICRIQRPIEIQFITNETAASILFTHGLWVKFRSYYPHYSKQSNISVQNVTIEHIFAIHLSDFRRCCKCYSISINSIKFRINCC